ncbi:DNA cytosine methyltransferase [Sciscionella marina]|uniref:DNA cytosine methyltransferase n=1 Tax=Sciscionella marina TaxID=508770 RepID=UPI000382C8B1|nr:DNA cytosine methyltransferase [Sciscionella marina]
MSTKPTPSNSSETEAAEALRFVSSEGPVIGSLCTGVAGLDLGVSAVLGGRIAWYCEPDPHAATILDARLPGIANLGDLRAVDFASVEPVEVLTAGFPCQDISAAGRRAGIEKGVRSGLWHSILDAIRLLRPALIVVENVAALRWRNGGLDRVLAGLAETGYDAIWRCLPAADIGAAHRRERVFLCAVPRTATKAPDIDCTGTQRQPRRSGTMPDGRGRVGPQRRRQPERTSNAAVADADRGGLPVGSDPNRAETGPPDPSRVRDPDRHGAPATDADRLGREKLHPPHPRLRRLPARPRTRTDHTPDVTEDSRPHSTTHPGTNEEVLATGARPSATLLPTPTAHDGSSNGISAASRQGGPSLLDTLRLLPTPRATDGTKGCPAQRGSKGDLMLPSVVIAVTAPNTATPKSSATRKRGVQP